MNWLRRSAVFVGRGFLWLAHGISFKVYYDEKGTPYYGAECRKEF